jgi:hypothetical protein
MNHILKELKEIDQRLKKLEEENRYLQSKLSEEKERSLAWKAKAEKWKSKARNLETVMKDIKAKETIIPAEKEVKAVTKGGLPSKRGRHPIKGLDFRAAITYMGREMEIGYYKTEEEARQAEENALKSL